MDDFFRFPHTPHLAWLGPGQPRDDKVLSDPEGDAMLAQPLVLEEKLDGANLGFSVAPEGDVKVQNRGQYLTAPFHGQFARMGDWLARHQDALFDALAPDLMAFGEWCAARHSLDYATLPDWWLMFDVFDRRTGRFWSTTRRDALAQQVGVAVVPSLGQGRFGRSDLQQRLLTSLSRYRAGPLEGLVLRQQDAHWLQQRAKLVRPDFTQTIETHWRCRTLQWNQVIDPATLGEPA